MTEFGKYHDGSFDGVWISDERTVHVFLRTFDQKAFTLVLRDVRSMKASNVREGNIILDVAVRTPAEITFDHIAELYNLAKAEQAGQVERILAATRADDLNLFEVSPSYGAEYMALFHSLEIRSGQVAAGRSCE